MENTMAITVFAKKRQTQDGKRFYNFLSSLTNKNTGEDIRVRVRFPEDHAPNVNDCPINIIINKSTANLSSKVITREDNDEKMVVYTLWVHEWEISDVPYIDHSLDEY